MNIIALRLDLRHEFKSQRSNVSAEWTVDEYDDKLSLDEQPPEIERIWVTFTPPCLKYQKWGKKYSKSCQNVEDLAQITNISLGLFIITIKDYFRHQSRLENTVTLPLHLWHVTLFTTVIVSVPSLHQHNVKMQHYICNTYGQNWRETNKPKRDTAWVLASEQNGNLNWRNPVYMKAVFTIQVLNNSTQSTEFDIVLIEDFDTHGGKFAKHVELVKVSEMPGTQRILGIEAIQGACHLLKLPKRGDFYVNTYCNLETFNSVTIPNTSVGARPHYGF